jgi:hypothetical protein
MQAAANAVKTPWKELFLDLRSNPAGTVRTLKLRVVSMSGALINVPIPQPIEATTQEIWKVRDACFSPPWYGMKMTISSAGQVAVDFNYDPTCTSDPAFSSN